ncbi:MAG TPA: BamA/TamA family outer membrane protein [Saprospiraceae bacterium]|nr:BamA/TamA family outer membrane protein [Saprospiraceae bacterium]HMP23186.1 BamA/TamA family outer membrane protein [Saprospiraceae bacterium]
MFQIRPFQWWYLLQWLVLLASLSACNTTKYLAGDEQLLVKNVIKLEEAKHVKSKTALKYDLATFYQQKPNTRFLIFFPREWFYFSTLPPRDTTKFARWKQRVIAEPPTIYHREIGDSTAKSMKYFLQYNGYYSAKVHADPVFNRKNDKKVQVHYSVKPGRQMLIDTVFFSSQDTNVQQILEDIRRSSMLRPGDPLTQSAYEQEKARITNHLRNNGYANFYANYVAPIEADSTLRLGRANVYFEILPPARDSSHKVYRIGDVTIYSQYNPLIEEADLLDTMVKGYRFRIPKNSTFKVRPQVIAESIHLLRGDVYSQDNYDLSIRQLSALSIYRFVRIVEEADANDPTLLNFRIELTRNTRMELDIGFDVNFTNRSATSGTGNLIGVFLSPSLRNRNLFRGAELLITNLSAGVEVNPNFTDNRFWNTIDLRAQTDLFFPRFNDYLGIWRGLYSARVSKKGGLISDEYYRLLHENAQTRLTASYNYLLLLDFYSYNLLNATFGYDLQKSDPTGTRRYIVNHVGVDFLRPVIEENFDTILRSNPFLERSFGKQLFVSLLFRDFSFVRTTRPNRYGNSHYRGLNIELAGAEIWTGNAIYNAFALRSDTLRLGDIDFSQYAKIEVDYRFFKQFSPRNSLASRISFGIAQPFGYTTDVPYVKQFYVGGPNSIRAWAIRGLGPGGHDDPLTQSARNRLFFYQTGDLKLEFSTEYRFNIFWRLNGAFFLDGGNVWTTREDVNRPGSLFLFNARAIPDAKSTYKVNDAFLRQIALGTGFGLRFDMSYFIFRFDMGVRMRSPFPLEVPEDRSVRGADYWYHWGETRFNELVNFNLGLGYPF